MSNFRTLLGAASIIGVTVLAALAGVGVLDTSEAAPRSPITPAVRNAALFCSMQPDISYDLQTQCIRVDLTPERSNGVSTFANGRALVRECIADARAVDSGHVRTALERHDYIRACLHSASM